MARDQYLQHFGKIGTGDIILLQQEIENAKLEREKAAAAASSSKATFDENHEKRQEFRRMIDPGILRPNPRHVALESLQVHKSYILCVGS